MSDLVEVGAQAMCNAAWAGVGEDWSLASDEQREEFRLMFRAALSVLEPRIEQLERELAEAVEAERERCAGIAEGSWVPAYVQIDGGEWKPGSPYDRGCVEQAAKIAAAIRTGERG